MAANGVIPMAVTPSLPKLLALDKNHTDFDDRVQEASLIAGVSLNEESSIVSSKKVPSRSRSEFVLKWALEKLKTSDSRQSCRASNLVWILLRELILVVPITTTARLLQSSGFIKNVRLFFEETSAFLLGSSNEASKHVPSLPASVNGPKASKKRKRGEKEPSPQLDVSQVVSLEQAQHAIMGCVSVLQGLLTAAENAVDANSRAHLSSALKTSADEAAQILGLWIRSLRYFLDDAHASTVLVLDDHEAILSIWALRSREQNDEAGASASVFSKHCLVPIIDLLSAYRIPPGARSSVRVKLPDSLEQLLAKHLFVPARSFFDASESSRNHDITKSRTALQEYLKPARDYITKLPSSYSSAMPIILKTLPQILDLAIKLCPSTTASQKIAELPWIESVFVMLLECAGETLSIANSKSTPTTNSANSPLTAMLDVLKSRSINPSSTFLDSILLSCTGLKGLQKSNAPLRLDVVAALLDLDSSIFLKETSGTGANAVPLKAGQPAYVEALMASLSEVKWLAIVEVSRTDVFTADLATERILIPLLRAYTTSRKLPSFISLWFWEARRSWKSIGQADEAVQCPWLSLELVQALRDILQINLSSARIGELIVEFILPVRQVLDEMQRASQEKKQNWEVCTSLAPACAAIVILDALLHSVEREETFKDNQAAWQALKDIPTQLASLDLSTFPAAERVWSIVTRVYKLSFLVDEKSVFLDRQKALLEEQQQSGLLVKAAKAVSELHKGVLHRSIGALSTFVWTVCGFELDTDFQDQARAYLQRIVSGTIGQDSWEFEEATGLRTAHIVNIASLCVQYPSTLSAIPYSVRRDLFRAMLQCAHDVAMQGCLGAVIDTCLEGNIGCLDDMTHELSTFIMEADIDLAMSTPLQCLLRIPGEFVPRAGRERILDGFLARALGDAQHDPDVIMKALAILHRFQGHANPEAKPTTQPQHAFEMAKLLDDFIRTLMDQTNNTLSLVRLVNSVFSSLMQQSLVKVFENREDRREIYHDEFAMIAQAKLDDMLAAAKADKMLKMVLPSPVMVLLIKNFLLTAADDVGNITKRAAIRKKLVKLLWSTATHNDQLPARSWVRFNVISDLLCGEGGNGSDKEKEEELGQQALAQQQSRDAHNIASATKIEMALQVGIVVAEFVAHLRNASSAQDRCDLLQIFERKMRTSRIHTKIEAVSTLLNDGSVGALQMLHTVLKQVSADEGLEQEDMKRLLLQLCHLLAQSSGIGEFGATMSCLNTILQEKPFLITQYGVDSLIATLTQLCSPKAPGLPNEHADFTYTRICRLVNSIILLHRRRLGGRMHLMVALLQNLMTCLFVPHQYQAASTNARPPWLANQKLDTASATAYTRVLTTLCSPTVSSTTKHAAATSLVSDLKKAKDYAGQYVTYLLLHYCTLQLQASIPIEVAEKLKQGLWAVMDIVDVEAMRGMNAGMGKGERVVWGSLWGEWRRVSGRGVGFGG